MPVIRFVREGRDVECFPGENLREVALREGIQLYGLKGTLGNCGGCGQCITCFVAVPEGGASQALSERTVVEDQKLRRRPRPGDWPVRPWFRSRCWCSPVPRWACPIRRPCWPQPGPRPCRPAPRPGPFPPSRRAPWRSQPQRAMKPPENRPFGGDTLPALPPQLWKPTTSALSPAFYSFWFLRSS